MKKIRIGKDVDVRWVVYVNGIEQDISDWDLSLVLTDAYGVQRDIEDFTVSNGNVLEFTLLGKDFKSLGKYIITIWLNRNKVQQSVYDYRYAFELVRFSDLENDETDDNIEIETVELSGNLETSAQGEVIGNYITQDQLDDALDGYAELNDISAFIRTGDLPESIVVVDDLSVYARKSDLSGFITMNDVSAVGRDFVVTISKYNNVYTADKTVQ